MIIKIHFYLFLFMAYLYYINKLKLFLLFYISILIHEIAHIAMALVLRVDINEILLMPFGVCASYSERITPKKELLISIAGPVLSFIIFIFSKEILIKNINLLILILNLIPVYPLDGGRIQKNIFIYKYGYDKGIKLSQLITDFFIVIIFVFSIFFICYFKNFYLLFLALYIYTLSKKEMKKERILRIINYLQTD